KAGKLPVAALSVEYALEYGVDHLELDPDAIAAGQRVVVIDDLLATGGTAVAAASLVRRAGGQVERALFVIELPDLGGATRLSERGISAGTLVSFKGD
ncbi:MAG: adenine phosphoribosyltransferase, partial [Alphaproteobacteria bacterium]|nr:adenine phosphoribosyltransferase [Alphaproteobacteria bacterium]